MVFQDHLMVLKLVDISKQVYKFVIEWTDKILK